MLIAKLCYLLGKCLYVYQLYKQSTVAHIGLHVLANASTLFLYHKL